MRAAHSPLARFSLLSHWQLLEIFFYERDANIFLLVRYLKEIVVVDRDRDKLLISLLNLYLSST